MTRTLAPVLFAAALAAPTVVHADPEDRALAVVVRGPLDGTALRADLARELGRAIAPADRCPETCLEVVVAGTQATVSYTAGGVPRMRVVELGGERAQWSTLITLLAGNVVRDEAADLLAELPEPPAPPSDPPVESPSPETPGPVMHPEPVVVIPPPLAPPVPPPLARDVLLETSPELPFAIGLVPGLSTDGLRIGRVRHAVGFHAIAGVSAGSSLLSIAGVADIQRGSVAGLQLGGVAAIAYDVDGFQIGGTLAAARALDGVQLGGLAALADRSHGLQIGGIAAVSRGRADLQVAGIGALADGDASVQVAGIVAGARGRAHVQIGGVVSAAPAARVQVAGLVNAARSANVQVAGLLNVADALDGTQVGVLNIARRQRGTQVGVINIGGADGASFGLINIVPGGRTDVEASYDSENVGAVLLRHGGNSWHNVYGVAGHQVDEQMTASTDNDDVWMYGFGFGPSWRRGAGRVDAELIGWQVNHGARHSTDVSILGQLRLTYAHDLGGISLVGGGVLNAYVSDDTTSPLLLERKLPGDPMTGDITVEVWPSAFVGVRL